MTICAPGRPRSIDDEALAGLINTTLHTRPADGATHWSVRSAGDAVGISKSSVARYFKMFGLQPHRQESFKLSTDAFFIEKLRDVVGLYLSPPDNHGQRRRCRGRSGAKVGVAQSLSSCRSVDGGVRILMLAPHPDDFDAIGLSLRHLHRAGHALHGLNQRRRSSSPPT